MSVASLLVAELLPEWEPFAAAVQVRPPNAGTWCEAWTVRDIVVHQAGNAEELGRVLHAHLNGRPVATRSFEEREAPYRRLDNSDLWSALVRRVEELSEISQMALGQLGPDAEVDWTGRVMRVAWFPEHMREELVLHRWDMTGDDPESLADLGAPWITEHSVIAVGRPLLARGSAGLDLGASGEFQGRLRAKGTDDVVVTAGAGGDSIALARPEGLPTVVSDPGTRCLFLWGRRPADPSRWSSTAGPDALRRLRTLLSGY
jgi:Mycothiol maleylpyruvate isomerase N-terminal domain